MRFKGAAQRFIRFWRIEKGLHDLALILNGKPDDRGFLNRFLRHSLGGINNELAYAAALDFGRALYDGERVQVDADFNACCSVWLLRHVPSLFLVVQGSPDTNQR
jgi:hypothetical protein